MLASSRSPYVAVLLLVVATACCYVNSLGGPFVFDDRAAILENPTVRSPASLGEMLAAPAGGQTVSGRPLVNLSLALNHFVGGAHPAGYHAVNVTLHLLAGLTLFGVVRRIGRQLSQAVGLAAQPAKSVGRQRVSMPRAAASQIEAGALAFAFVVSLVWLVHPLQTAAVTYIVQRAEVMAGLFLLLTLYGFVRATEADQPGAGRGWLVISMAACAAGMMSKEVMAGAPLLVLLYDRTFVSGSFRSAWRGRRGYYLALAGTWVLLALLSIASGARGGTVGFGAGVSWWRYALTQAEAIVTYLRLSLWPAPLVFDRGEYLVSGMSAVVPEVLVVLLLLAATVLALWRWPKIGFLGAWFFVILAPTSSVVPVASQTIAEHRMYLPLAAVVVAIAVAARRWVGARAGLALMSLGGVLAAGGTIVRNRVYLSEIALWTDTARKAPANPRAHANLGSALGDAGQFGAAAAAFEAALQLQPNSPELHLNLCHAYTKADQLERAVAHGGTAVQLAPQNADARLNLAAALVRAGRHAEATEQLAEARRLRPDDAAIGTALGDVLVEQAQSLARAGRTAEAGRIAAEAVKADPTSANAHFASGNVAVAASDFERAIAAYQRALALAPEDVRARNNLANVLVVTGRYSEAVAEFSELLRIRPGDRFIEENLQRARELQRGTR